MLNVVDNDNNYNCNNISKESIAIGFGTIAAGGTRATAVGMAAKAMGGQATVLGTSSGAKRQATAIGNDVFAYGNSSVAIGNDDIADSIYDSRYQDKLPEETIRNIFGALYGSDGFYTKSEFDSKYIENKGSDMRIYSPTYAAKLGAIAIGSRAIAGGEVSISVGSLSFALADRSTAMGIRTFVAQDAVGGTAIGEQSRVFAPHSIAMGNYTESAAQGSFSYGYNAKAIGQGALAFGYASAAGAKINREQYDDKLLDFTRGLHALDLFKADGSIDDEKVKQFDAGVNTLIKGGDVNGTQFGGVAQMFTDETLFEKDRSKEYLNIGGKSIYKTATSTSTFNSADAAENSFAMGRYAFALRSNAMAFGYSTIADAQYSLAIGSFAHTHYTADNSIAFGVNTYAEGRNNFVAGYSSRSYANDSMALGVGSYIGQRSENSTAIGKVAKVKEDTTNGMAIGNYSEASINNSVALGVNSKTDYDPEDLNQPGWVAKGAIAIPTSAATGLISVGAINNERRITNVASGYADTDAANVAQLRTIDEKFDNRIDSLENGGGVQYQSIDKSNTAGEAAKLGRTLNEVKDYQQYITLEKQWIGFKAREILNGEQVNEASLQAMKDKADKLNEGGRFDSLSSELKALEQSLLAEAKGIDKAKYDDYVSRLTTAFDSDSTRLPNNLTAEQIANLKKGTNYDNDGAQGADSIAFGWKAKTNVDGKNAIALGVEAGGENGVSGEDGIAIGTKSKVSGNASIAMGKDNNVSGNNSIAVGTALTIAGNNAGAFGDPSTINYDNSYSVGNNNTIGTATTTETEKGSFVVGNNVEVSADNVFVLGSGESSDNKLKASQDNSVYLGVQSNVVTTGSAGATDKYEEATIGGQKFGKFAGSTPVGVVTVGNDNQTRRVQGVAAGLIAENSTDAINGSQLFATNTYLTNLAEKIGLNGKPINGVDGASGADGTDGLQGPAGRDGLNDTTLVNKVQSLRDGVAGTVVYTDTDGKRVLAENGKYYSADIVSGKVKANNGLWYDASKVNPDGTLKDANDTSGKTLAELGTAIGSDKVMLSAVNADGQTTQPITIANLKDNLVVAEVTPAEQANAENLAKAANGGKDLTDEQKAAVAKALKDQKVNATVASLLANTNTNTNTNVNELSRAVTLRDLQTVAQAGLSFAGNDSNNPIHQALGTTLLIQGKSGATYSEAVYSADNLITRNDNGTLRIEMKKTPTFDGIILDGKGQDGKDGYIGVDAEGNVVVKNGVDGLAGKDGKDGVDGASKVLTEGSVNASAQLTYKAEGQGYTKDGQKVDKPTVSLADGLNFKGDSNIKTAVNANGEVDITLNKDLTVDSIGGGEGKGKLSFEANDTINANNSRITGIADGKNRGDAVNKGQMDDAIGAVNTNINNIKNEVVNKGMNFATSNDDGKTKSTQTAKLGDTVVVKAGANVDVSEVNEDAEGTFSYTISVKGIPMTYVDADGKPLVQVGDDFYHLQENGAVNFASTATPAGVKVVKDTTKLNDKAVANDQLSTVDVANGEIKNGSQQAVTGGQVADLLGVTVDKDGKVKDGKSGENGIGGTGKNTVSEAISETVKIAKSGNTEVKAGKNVIVTKGTGTNGTTAYTVSMDTSNLEVEKLILGKGDNKTTISVVNQSQYQGSEKAIDVGGTRITNVKDGIDPTDAVNVGQMNKLANATSKAINNVNRRVDHLTQESRAGIAGAMATAGLQQSTERGRTTVSVGSAVFKGESAVALGLSKLSDSGKVGIRISGMTTSNGDTGGSVSVGYTW